MHITVKVVATDSAVTALSVVIVLTLLCTSLVQHCHYQCCHNAVLVFADTALCSFSLTQHCARFRCHSAVHVGVLPLRDSSYTNDSGQNEAERSNAYIGEALMDCGSLYWEHYK